MHSYHSCQHHFKMEPAAVLVAISFYTYLQSAKLQADKISYYLVNMVESFKIQVFDKISC